MTVLKEGIRNVNELSTCLSDKNSRLEEEINGAFDAIAKLVNDRRDELLSQLKQTEQNKQLTLGKQRDELEGSLADLYTSCEFVEKALTHGSETEILLVKKQVCLQISKPRGFVYILFCFQVGERLVEYGQMQVVTTPAENNYLTFEKGN